ncbi:hypothetical protein GJ744_011023 [Endocarpon pusillum]|uniref:Uncharacterized protein n=1 Tax=Endocarpon pusillum TaxID=364733 RepID=A0A8H7AF93_9EURO|nr:hypothetical protein GJ744_011023 [Endocarpon pusillum]
MIRHFKNTEHVEYVGKKPRYTACADADPFEKRLCPIINDVPVSHGASKEWMLISPEPEDKRGLFQREVQLGQVEFKGFSLLGIWLDVSWRMRRDDSVFKTSHSLASDFADHP